MRRTIAGAISAARPHRSGLRVVPVWLLLALTAVAAGAQPRAESITLGRTTAVVHRPQTGTPHVAVLYENGRSTGHRMCTELAERGFLTLCMDESGTGDNWENVALEIKAGVDYARSQQGITKVVLYGHSGGGAIASFYQAVAENGVKFCQDPRKLSACSDQLAGLTPVDGVLFPDAHPGLAVMDVRMINPSVADGSGTSAADPALDPFSAANGYQAGGKSHYSPEFQQRYYKAQAAVMTRLIAQAQQLREQARSGKLADPAADRVTIPSFGMTCHLGNLDNGIDLLMKTREPRRLLKNDGSIVTEVVRSVASGGGFGAGQPPAPSSSTSGRFLSRVAVRATDSINGVEYCSANTATVCNAQNIRVPVLFIAAGAGNFIADEELMYQTSPAKDREFIVVEGATHGGQPCRQCGSTPDQFANSERNMYDYIASWINKRF